MGVGRLERGAGSTAGPDHCIIWHTGQTATFRSGIAR